MTTFILIAAPLSLAIETPMTKTMSYLLILIVPALFLLAKRHSKREKKAVKEILESSEELNQGLKSQDLTLEDTIGKKLD
ncbi:hypothetical protein [Vibrio owensii]|uniref:hypothetical protein n=1 Tax=Vibrio harveyi group TaxID=717610 RepID=UPI003CC63ABB